MAFSQERCQHEIQNLTMPCDDEPHSRARGVHHARTHVNELARLTMTTTPPRDDDETLFTVADASGHFAADWGSEEEDVDVEADDDDYSEGADVAEEVDALDEDEIDEWVDADGADLGPGTPSPKKGGGGWDEDVHSGEEEDEAEAAAAAEAEEEEEEEEGEIQDLLTGAPLAKPAPPKKKKPTSTNAAPRCANAASSAAATKPGAGVAPEVRAWIADAATLRGKQKQLETAISSAAARARLPPDVEPIATHGAAAAEEDQDELRADLAARLKRVRSNVFGLGLHVANVASGLGAFYTTVPIRPRSRGERRSLRTLPGVSLRSSLAFNPRPRRLSTPPDAFQLHPDNRSYGTTLRVRRPAGDAHGRRRARDRGSEGRAEARVRRAAEGGEGTHEVLRGFRAAGGRPDVGRGGGGVDVGGGDAAGGE